MYTKIDCLLYDKTWMCFTLFSHGCLPTSVLLLFVFVVGFFCVRLFSGSLSVVCVYRAAAFLVNLAHGTFSKPSKKKW